MVHFGKVWYIADMDHRSSWHFGLMRSLWRKIKKKAEFLVTAAKGCGTVSLLAVDTPHLCGAPRVLVMKQLHCGIGRQIESKQQCI